MSISVNIRHLEKHGVMLTGEASVEELVLESKDELIRFDGPVNYQLDVQEAEQGILVQGAVSVEVECDCARCLKTFIQPIVLSPWTVHLPLAGDDAVPLENDCVDLTPYLREDILLALPQHPLCSTECQGLLRGGAKPSDGLGEDQASPWNDLDKLDL